MTQIDERPAAADAAPKAAYAAACACADVTGDPCRRHLRRRRRRLLLGSAPVVVLLVLVAARLLSLNLVHAQTLDAYEAGDKPRTLLWGERQGWVNVVEQFRSPFAIGDAHVLSGHFELARPWFEQAFEQVPKGGIDDCKVRVNLGLTYEALGDAAKARERTDEWKQYYDKGIAITKERPPLCEAPDGGTDRRAAPAGAAADGAEERRRAAAAAAATGTEQQPGPQPSRPSPSRTPTTPRASRSRTTSGAAAAEHHRAQPATAAGQRRHVARRQLADGPQAVVRSLPGLTG